jgi:CRISPR-associated protein Csy2
MEKGKDALNALIDALSVKTDCIKTDNNEPLWQTKRIYQGWLVPIAVGFQGISELTPPGKTLCQRDNSTPHRFAEPIVTLGEFKLPARIKNFESAFWQYQYLEDKNLYLCINKGE